MAAVAEASATAEGTGAPSGTFEVDVLEVGADD